MINTINIHFYIVRLWNFGFIDGIRHRNSKQSSKEKSIIFPSFPYFSPKVDSAPPHFIDVILSNWMPNLFDKGYGVVTYLTKLLLIFLAKNSKLISDGSNAYPTILGYNGIRGINTYIGTNIP